MLQTLGPALTNALIASLIFLYLWIRDRESYLIIWALAWMLWVVRYTFGLLSAEVELVPASVVLPLLALARGGLILWGTYSLIRRPVPRFWLALLGVDLGLILLEGVLRTPISILGPPGTPHYLLFSACLTWSGVLLARAQTLPRFESRVTGSALVVFGVAQATYPMLGVLPAWYTQSVYILVATLQALIPIGVLMAHLRRSSNEVGALHDALEGALTRALAELLPICAHCKAIREEGEWVDLERYVSDRTEATFTHGVCPTCMDEHYAGFEPVGSTASP